MVTTEQLVITRFLILVCLLVSPASIYAETKVLTAEATYTMGDGESPSFAEAMVLQKAKQMALEQAGTYVESYTKVQNYELTAEEIQTIAGGVLQVEVLERNRSLVGEGLRFYVKIKATVTSEKMEELAERIRGKNLAKEYHKIQEEYLRLSREIESLKQLLAKAQSSDERKTTLDEIREREKSFELVQEQEEAFFTRLVSGKALITSAENERDIVDRLARKILDQGNLVSIGSPESHFVADNHSKVSLRVPVTVQANKALLPFVQDTARLLGGEPEIERTERGVLRIKLVKDRNVALYVRRRVSPIFFNVKFVLDSGEEIFPCAAWAWRSSLRLPRRPVGLIDFDGVERNILIWPEPIRYTVTLEMPASVAKQIQSVSARYEEIDRSSVSFANYLQDFLTKEERKQLGSDPSGGMSPLAKIPYLEFELMFQVSQIKTKESVHLESAYLSDDLAPAERDLLRHLLAILGKRQKQFIAFVSEKLPICTLSESDK